MAEGRHGYEMTKRLRDRGLAGVGEGSIYPLLGRLSVTVSSRHTGPRVPEGRPEVPPPPGSGRVALAMGVSECELPAMPPTVLALVKIEDA
jgi:hypothetical protein